MNAKGNLVTAALIMAAAAVWAQSGPPDAPQGQPPPGMPPMMQQGAPCPMQQGAPCPMQPGGMPQGGPGPMAPQGGPGGDPLMENFFPPELIMQHQQALELTDDQKKAIREIMQKSVAEFTDLQWQQSAEQEVMTTLLKKTGNVKEPVDEAKVLEQLDKLMKIENQIKRLHLGVMIKVRNALTPEQLNKLNRIKRSMAPMAGARNAGRMGAHSGGAPNMGKPPMVPQGEPQP